MGWMFKTTDADPNVYCRNLVKDPMVVFMSSTFFLWVILHWPFHLLLVVGPDFYGVVLCESSLHTISPGVSTPFVIPLVNGS